MKVLELFSGTGSVEKVCKKLEWESVSVDKFLPADHFVDIFDFDYKQYDKNHFDIIWASPPCTAYSKLQDSWIGRMRKNKEIFTKEKMNNDMLEADLLVKKSLEIINYFNPKWWFMENPQTGKLKTREVVEGLNYYDVDYCMYSDWGYKKRTRIWTNRTDFKPKLCDGSGNCGNMVMLENKKQHQKVLANGYEIVDGKKTLCNTKEKRDQFREYKKHNNQVVPSKTATGTTNKLDRYRVPENLILDLFNEK